MIILTSIEQIQRQILTNFKDACAPTKEEEDIYNEFISNMTVRELITSLLESHQLRENSPNLIDHYHIGEISKN